MPISCKFELSRSSNIYYSGEEITGSLTICSAKQTQVEAIILEFYGQSQVQWWELDKSDENIMHNDFSAHEVSDKTLYKREQKHVCEQLKLDTANNKQLLPHVEYTFCYCLSIPQQAPATLTCLYGQTEYGLRLKMQRLKKVDKEFHQRIVIKNKLDLTQGISYKKPFTVYHQNEFGQMSLQIPCSGYTPGQKLPYYLKYRSAQPFCKVIIQFNCYTTCRSLNNGHKSKQLKHIMAYKKHLTPECTSFVNIPLHCKISSTNDPELIISWEYLLEAFLVNSNKKTLLSVAIPLTIGTNPCCIFDGGLGEYMCYNNLGSSSSEMSTCSSQPKSLDLVHHFTDELVDSFWNLAAKRKN